MTSTRAFTGLEIAAAVALAGLLGWFAFPKFFHGASKRAAEGTKAATAVEAATAKVDAAEHARSASVAASVVTMGKAVPDLPVSPATDFFRNEIPLVLSQLPAPDPAKLLEAERRRVAVMQGERDAYRAMYADAAGEAKRQAELIAKERADRELAEERLRQANLEHEKAAAAELVQARQKFIFIGIAVLFGLGWVYKQFYGISVGTLGQIAADIRAGTPPIQALSELTPPRIHKAVQRAAKLATELKPEAPSVRS